MIKLVEDNVPVVCKICEREFKDLRAFGQHPKAHNLTSKEYTFIYLMDSKEPECQCGCGKKCSYKAYYKHQYVSGHNPDCFWQNKSDKDSDEYKEIVSKISNSVREYAADNPREVSDETRLKISIKTKEIMNREGEKEKRFSKMKETKRVQSENGTLSANHWINNWSEEELEKKLKENGEKIAKTKRERGSTAWNKGLTVETDNRIDQWSGENNYRYNYVKGRPYTRKFRNKEYRKLILESQDSCCFKCKTTDKQLCLHHVDENPTNDDFNNLIFLCRSCHIRIHSVPKLMEDFKIEVYNFKNKKEK